MFGIYGVAVGIVDILVTFQDAALGLIVVGATEVVVAVGRGRCQNGVIDLGAHNTLNLLEILLVGGEGLFVLRGQSIVTHVLLLARVAGGVEGIGHAVLCRHAPPNGFGVLVGVIVNRQAAFIEFLSILEYVLADFSEIDIEVAAQVLTGLARLHEGIHHPELDILNVGRLKVGDVQLAHHAAPTFAGIVQVAIGIQRRVKVVGTALVRIVRQVEHIERGGFLEVDTLVREEFVLIHLTYIGVGQLRQVALDISRSERGRTTGEERVNIIPCQERTVVAVANVARQRRFGELAGHARDSPFRGGTNVNSVLGILEVVNV